jgi:hypothetical protein
MVVGIRQAKVNELHIVPIVRDKDIVGLEVAVYNLFAVIIIHRRQQFLGNLQPCLSGRILLEEFLERHTIHILHHNNRTSYRVCFITESSDNIGMIHLHPQFELLDKQTLIHSLLLVLRFQSFQHKPLAVTLGFIQLIETMRREFGICGEHIRDFLDGGSDFAR